MKINQFFNFSVLAILFIACSEPKVEPTTADTATPAAASKAMLSITSASDISTAQYDKVVEALTASGDWVKDWSYHAIGTMQPQGIFTFGVYPNQTGLDRRRGIYKDLFPSLGINAPAPQIQEVHNIIMGAQPAQKTTKAFIASFAQANMTADSYAQVLKELEAGGAGTPSGRLYHVSYMTDNGVQVIDVWESEEQFKAFGGILMPILQSKGITAQPTIYPLHNSLILQ